MEKMLPLGQFGLDQHTEWVEGDAGLGGGGWVRASGVEWGKGLRERPKICWFVLPWKSGLWPVYGDAPFETLERIQPNSF